MKSVYIYYKNTPSTATDIVIDLGYISRDFKGVTITSVGLLGHTTVLRLKYKDGLRDYLNAYYAGNENVQLYE